MFTDRAYFKPSIGRVVARPPRTATFEPCGAGTGVTTVHPGEHHNGRTRWRAGANDPAVIIYLKRQIDICRRYFVSGQHFAAVISTGQLTNLYTQNCSSTPNAGSAKRPGIRTIQPHDVINQPIARRWRPKQE